MWPNRFPLLLLLLLIATTARRANATLGCYSSGFLRDTTGTCRAGDIQRVFGGNLLTCSNGFVSIIDGSSLTFTSHSLSINDKDLVYISDEVHTLLEHDLREW